MKNILLALVLSLFRTDLACAQGALIFDQQSATNNGFPYPPLFLNAIEDVQPVGQSFVTSLPAIGFVQFGIAISTLNRNPLVTTGAWVHVNLWSGGISNGVLLASTAAAFIRGEVLTNFFFASSVPLSSGTTYYLQPFIQPGGAIALIGEVDTPRGAVSADPIGMAYFNGIASPSEDLWYREGIVATPEPMSGRLLMPALFILAAVSRKIKRDDCC